MPRFSLLAALLLILLGVWGGGGGVTLRLWIRPGNPSLFCRPVRQVRTAKTTSSSRLSVYFQRICSERKYFHKSLRLTRLKSSIAKSVEKINCTSEDYPLQRVKNFHFLFTQRIILLLDNMQPIIVSNDGPTMSEMSVLFLEGTRD